LALAAGSGRALRVEHTLLNDPLIECIKAFNQTGAGLSWEENGAVLARAGEVPPLPDKALFVGNDTLNLYLLLGRYLLWPSHAKFAGDADLRLHNLAPLRRFAPSLGARLTCIVPKSDALPARLEASGLLPEEIFPPADLPADALSGLLIAAACGPKTLLFDLSAHDEADAVLEEALDVLQACKTNFFREGRRVRIEPGAYPPPAPDAGMDLTLAFPLLALPAFCGGSVRLRGSWPSCEAARQVERLLQCAGLNTERIADGISSHRPEKKRPLPAPELARLPERFLPTALALAVLPALRGQAVPLPALPEKNPEQLDFLEALGLRLEGGMALPPAGPVPRDATPWAAPTPSAALAFALAAFARPHLKLADPGIMASLYPPFWNLYNNLPTHGSAVSQAEKEAHDIQDAAPQRKRIRLDVPAGTGETPDDAGG
jgi:5-enolpyruvylshikimate-3-phosphate synthase